MGFLLGVEQDKKKKKRNSTPIALAIRVIEHERRPTPTRHDEREQHNNEVYGEEQYHNGRQEDGHRRNEACSPVFVEPRSCAGKIIHFPWSM